MKRLEKKLQTKRGSEIIPVDEYIKLFPKRYKEEEMFRDWVHSYLNLSMVKKIGLSIGKIFFHSWYEKQTDDIIRQYAEKIRPKLEIAIEAKKELRKLQAATAELEEKAYDVTNTTEVQQKAQDEYAQTTQKYAEAKQQIDEKYSKQKTKAEDEARHLREQVEEKTNVEKIVKESLRNHISKSSLVSVDKSGRLTFDEEKMTEVLEGLFLDEIIEGIENEDGQTGFFSRLKSTYEGVIAYWDGIEDLSELPNTDWIQSAIYARTKGLAKPQYPYLIVGKPESILQNKSSIDTAISIDTSGSMDNNNRLTMAKKTGLATHALQRRLNPKNSTFLSHYNNDVYPVTTMEFLRDVNAGGSTSTDLALNWLVDTLVNRGPSIAYLITDGYPEGSGNIMERTHKAARRFRQYQYLMLRIFLIDGDKTAMDIVRGIGKEAGPDTKVIPVKSQKLGKELILDYSKAIQDMYSIADF